MFLRKFFLFTSLLKIFLVPAHAHAKQEHLLQEIPVGITEIDLTGDGTPDKIIRAYRENMNAHSFYTTFFIWNGLIGQEDGNTTRGFDIIGIEKPELSPVIRTETRTDAGADCTTVDQRLFPTEGGAFLIEASYAGPQSAYCMPNTIVFRIFSIKHNDGSELATTYLFKPYKVWTSTDKYADVNDAFRDNEKTLIEFLQ